MKPTDAMDPQVRPWGSFTILYEAPGFVVKHLEISPGGILSLQYHRLREEHWRALNEGVTAVINGETLIMDTNRTYRVQCNVLHRLSNHTDEPVSIIEIITGQYDEEDIVRVQDIYNRK